MGGAEEARPRGRGFLLGSWESSFSSFTFCTLSQTKTKKTWFLKTWTETHDKTQRFGIGGRFFFSFSYVFVFHFHFSFFPLPNLLSFSFFCFFFWIVSVYLPCGHERSTLNNKRSPKSHKCLPSSFARFRSPVLCSPSIWRVSGFESRSSDNL